MPSDATEADVQELTDHLSAYLRRVEENETIIVTSEGELPVEGVDAVGVTQRHGGIYVRLRGLQKDVLLGARRSASRSTWAFGGRWILDRSGRRIEGSIQ